MHLSLFNFYLVFTYYSGETFTWNRGCSWEGGGWQFVFRWGRTSNDTLYITGIISCIDIHSQ